MQSTVSEKAQLEKTIAEMHKLNEETRKFVEEAHKMRAEAAFTIKKNRWYEITIVIAIIAATATFTKFFL